MEVDEYQNSSSPPSQSLISKKLKHDQDGFTTGHGVSNGVLISMDSSTTVKSSTTGSNNSADYNCSTSDLSYQDDANDDGHDAYDDGVEANDEEGDAYDDGVFFDDDEVASDYGDDDQFADNDDDDNYLKLQAQFDHVDLPPGVEAAVTWLPDPSPSEEKPLRTDPSSSLKEDKNSVASSSRPRSSLKIIKEETMDDVLRKLMYFKQFDTVSDVSDHHFQDKKSSCQPSKSWAKKIQDEWRILENNLPETIFVRVYESRMDLLRAVIIGPQGTPYHDGLYVFDAYFTDAYPHEPPVVFFHASGFRMNPNLYDCGKVCLSLLNTWSGGKDEMWIPDKSTMLQVLVSIQALILNAEPFFNEPGYEKTYKGADGKARSREYSENVFIMSLKKMMYILRNPPQHFEDLVAGHFRLRANDILTACQVYVEGAEVGCNIKSWRENGVNAKKTGSARFKADVANFMPKLARCFVNNGSKDCEKFLDPDV